jgi:hypothetical protein
VDQIDRELASILSVEPSPEFRARVRARIDREPGPLTGYLQRRVALALAAVAAVTAVVGVALVRLAPTRPARVAAPVAENRPAAPALAADVVTAQPPHVAVMPPRRRAPRADAPEVVVDNTAVRGLRQLDAIVRDGRTRFVFAEDQVVRPEPVTDIIITPIAVAPIEVAMNVEPVGSSEGDQQ